MLPIIVVGRMDHPSSLGVEAYPKILGSLLFLFVFHHGPETFHLSTLPFLA